MKKIIISNRAGRISLAAALSFVMLFTLFSPFKKFTANAAKEPLITPEKVYYGKISNDKTEADFTEYYLENISASKTTYTRLSKSAVASPNILNRKNNVPVIFGGKYTYFSMEFDYKFSTVSTKEQLVWVTLGIADKTKFSEEEGGLAFSIASKASVNTDLNIYYSGKSDTGLTDNLKYDGTAEHHIEFSVIGKSLTIKLDGEIVATKEIDVDYVGGYVGIGTAQQSVELSNICIGSVETDSQAYIGNAESSKVLSETKKYYEINEENGEKSYKRNDYGINSNWQNAAFLNAGNYENFALEYDFKLSGTGEEYVWVLIGNENPMEFNKPNGSIALGLGIKDASLTETYMNGFFDGQGATAWFDGGGWLDVNGKGSVLDGTAKHHAKVTVSDGILTIEIDNGVCFKKRSLDDTYNGGFVLIGTGSTGSIISNITVMDVDKTGNILVRKTEDLEKGNKTGAVITDYYLLKDTQFTRKNFEVGTEKDNIAFICNDTYYSDFETTFDLSIPTNSPIGDYYSYITLGSLNNYESFETLMLTGSGIVGIKLSVTETGREYSVYYNSGNGAVWGEPKIMTKLIDEAYKIKLTVKENKLTLDMDSEKILEENISSRYSGGIVAIGTPNAGVSFNDFKTVGTTNLMDSFDSYFSEDLSGSENLQQVNADEYWEVNGGMLVRNKKNNASSHTNNMAVLYYNVSKFNNFELTFNYKAVKSGDTGAYVGFGAEKGKSWYTDKKNPDERTWQPDDGNNLVYLLTSGTAQIGPTASFLEGSNQSNWWHGTWLTQAGTLFTTTEQQEAYHTMRIRVQNGTATVWINDLVQGSFTMPKYKEGYIYFASSVYGVSFGLPKVIDYDNEPQYDFSAYNAYFGEDAEKGIEPCNAQDYWMINSNGNIERRSVDSKIDVQDNKEMAYLMFKNNQYPSFSIDLDYKHGTTGWGRFFIGFGAQEGKSFYEKDGGVAVTMSTGGYLSYIGNIYENGRWIESVFWPFLDDDGNTLQIVPNYNRAKWNHLHMEVAAGLCTVRINDYEWDFDLNVEDYMTSGHIFLAANSSLVEFRNIEIMDLSTLYPEDTSTGWEPTDADVYFDFTKRKKVIEPIHKYSPKFTVEKE